MRTNAQADLSLRWAYMSEVTFSDVEPICSKQMQNLLTFFFSKNISVYATFNDQSFNDTLTNDIISVEQLGPDIFPSGKYEYMRAIFRSVLTL